MKILIAGSRSIHSKRLIERIFNDLLRLCKETDVKITELVSGYAEGVDKLAEACALEHKIYINRFIPDWNNIKAPRVIVKENSYGKYNARAGIDRNKKMAKHCDIGIIVWDGKSTGTQNMIEELKAENKPTVIYKPVFTNNDWWLKNECEALPVKDEVPF